MEHLAFENTESAKKETAVRDWLSDRLPQRRSQLQSSAPLQEILKVRFLSLLSPLKLFFFFASLLQDGVILCEALQAINPSLIQSFEKEVKLPIRAMNNMYASVVRC
jgi:hypothetical protein